MFSENFSFCFKFKNFFYFGCLFFPHGILKFKFKLKKFADHCTAVEQ
jgi:hypothetical protein